MPEDAYPWLNSYPDQVLWRSNITPCAVFTLLEDTARLYPENPAFDFLGKKYKWQEIYSLACKMAKGLQERGIQRGENIGLFLPNTPYYIVCYYAILMIGARVVNLNPLYAEEELKLLIKDSEITALITTDLHLTYDKIIKIETNLKHLILCPFAKVLPFPKNIIFPILRRKDLARVRPAHNLYWFDALIQNDGNYKRIEINPLDDLAVLQYTGGTTGTPKAAMLTHANIYINAVQAKLWFHPIKVGQGKMLGVLPFFHVFAMTAVMNFSVANALEIIALPRFDLYETLKIIHHKKPQLFPAVPAIYSAINHAKGRKRYDLSSLRYCLSGGAPLPMEVKKQFEAHNPNCIVIEGYGLTESSPVVCVNPPVRKVKEGSIGLPFPDTIIEIIDPKDKTTILPVGEKGELCVRGPQVMQGYWKKPESSADVLRKTPQGDMRLYTGDVAVMDAQGYVFIVDRIKDMIITNGYNVYPRNVEEAIYKHKAIEECIVAGLPDAQRGEIVKAWIKLKPSANVSEDELKDFLKQYISPMEIPRKFEFRSAPLPKTMIGKLSRKDVLAQESKT